MHPANKEREMDLQSPESTTSPPPVLEMKPVSQLGRSFADQMVLARTSI